MFHGHDRDVFPCRVGCQPSGGVRPGPAICGVPCVQHRRYRARAGSAICGLLAGLARLLCPGRARGANPCEPEAEILLPTSDAMLAFIGSGLLTHPEMVGLNPEYLHELMWGGAPRAALARAILAGKLWHFDINDGYRLKHDVDIAVGLVNPFDWLAVLMLLRSHKYAGPFNLDYKPPRTTSNWGVFALSFPTAVDRFITLWEMAGDVIADPVIAEASAALRAGGGPADPLDVDAIVAANRELLTLHELIEHRIVQVLIGAHRGGAY